MDSPKEEGVRSLFSVNDKAAQAFAEIAEYMELKGENPFKIKAYVKAAQALRTLDEDLVVLVREDRVQKVPGIGKSVAQKLTLLLETGRIPQLEALRREVPAGLLQVARLPGLGAKKTAQLHRDLGVTNLSDLQEALGEGRVAELKGFSKKSEQKLLLAFTRHLGCTFCREQLQALKEHYESLRSAGIEVLAVTMRPPASTLPMQQQLDLPFPCACDPELALYRAYRTQKGSYWNVLGPSVWGRAIRSLPRGPRLSSASPRSGPLRSAHSPARRPSCARRR